MVPWAPAGKKMGQFESLTGMTLPPAWAIPVGASIGALGGLATYHAFDAIGKTRSGWGKTGLVVAGVLGVGLGLKGLLTVAGGVSGNPMTPV